jgi:hypothetical protein
MNFSSKMSVGKIQRILADDWFSYENAADIIADIMHYCDAMGHPFEAVLNTAQGYYEMDQYEEDPPIEALLEDDGA